MSLCFVEKVALYEDVRVYVVVVPQVAWRLGGFVFGLLCCVFHVFPSMLLIFHGGRLRELGSQDFGRPSFFAVEGLMNPRECAPSLGKISWGEKKNWKATQTDPKSSACYCALRGCGATIQWVREWPFGHPLPVVAMGSIPHIYRREGLSPGGPRRGCPVSGNDSAYVAMGVAICANHYYALTDPKILRVIEEEGVVLTSWTELKRRRDALGK